MSSYRRKFLFRIPAPDHDRWTAAAHAEGLSLNQWLLEVARAQFDSEPIEDAEESDVETHASRS